MRRRRVVATAVLAAGALLLGTGTCPANAAEGATLEGEIRQIRREMEELRRRHAEELRVLREELRWQRAEEERFALQADVDDYLTSTEAAGREGEPRDTVFTARGAALAVEFLCAEGPRFPRAQVMERLDRIMGHDSGFVLEEGPDSPANRRALARVRERWDLTGAGNR